MDSLRRKHTVERRLFVSYLWAMILPMLLFTLCVAGYLLLGESRKKREQFLHVSDSIIGLVNSEFSQIDEFVIGLSVTN